jgi:hypothetical protein
VGVRGGGGGGVVCGPNRASGATKVEAIVEALSERLSA